MGRVCIKLVSQGENRHRWVFNQLCIRRARNGKLGAENPLRASFVFVQLLRNNDACMMALSLSYASKHNAKIAEIQ